MTSASTMCDVTGMPIAWVEKWAGPHEGAMTLALKYAWANALDGAAASKSICGKTVLQHNSQRIHGRSFLDPTWARAGSLGTQPSIGGLIARRDIFRYAGRWGRWIASDTHFRYCPQCIQFGYQCLLYQVDGLEYCPLHRVQLISECRCCHVPTSRYALTAEALASPFCCHACGATYAEGFDPRSWKQAEFHAGIASALLPLVRFFRRAARANIDWLHWTEWFGPWLGEVEQREKRIATFAVLRQILRLPMADDFFTAPERPLSVSRGRQMAPVGSNPLTSAADSRSRYLIYKAIRRHLLKRLPRHVSRRALLRPKRDELNLRNEIVWLSLKKCPFIQTVWLWRLRFEEYDSVLESLIPEYARLTLREEALNWPWRGGGDEAVWAHYVLTSFHTSAEIVFEWWQKATAGASSGQEGRGNARSMELHTEFASLLSPFRLPAPPRITAVIGPARSHLTPSPLYVVGPRAGFEKLSACCGCNNSGSQAHKVHRAVEEG